MRIEFIKENENKLLERKEINCLITEIKTTPSRKEIIKKIAALKGVPEENIVIENINQEFGKRETKATVRVYKNLETMKKIEPAYLIKRLKGKEEKTTESKPKEKKEETTEKENKPEEMKKEKTTEKKSKSEAVKEEKTKENKPETTKKTK